jgi:hypothetical protein
MPMLGNGGKDEVVFFLASVVLAVFLGNLEPTTLSDNASVVESLHLK